MHINTKFHIVFTSSPLPPPTNRSKNACLFGFRLRLPQGAGSAAARGRMQTASSPRYADSSAPCSPRGSQRPPPRAAFSSAVAGARPDAGGPAGRRGRHRWESTLLPRLCHPVAGGCQPPQPRYKLPLPRSRRGKRQKKRGKKKKNRPPSLVIAPPGDLQEPSPGSQSCLQARSVPLRAWSEENRSWQPDGEREPG